MKTLVIGHGGMLGRAWSARLDADGQDWLGMDYPEFDLSSNFELPSGFDRVVCCAAYTDVDGAEENEAQATRINGDGIERLAAGCARQGILLVHYGTDYVFSGDADTPYATDTPLQPLNAYGRSKAAGERALAASDARFLHIRTSWLYAPWANNFVRTMAKLTKERDSLTVVDDQRGRPTSAEQLVDTSLRLIDAGAEGIFHASDGGECTWHGFASFINEHLGHGCAIAPCTTDAFPRPAKRPAYSVLDLSKTESLIGPVRGWKENVADVLDRL